MTLPTFNPSATCPKCGGEEIGAYHVPASRYPDSFHERANRLDMGEHIRRTCTRCGYAWPEAPLDQETG